MKRKKQHALITEPLLAELKTLQPGEVIVLTARDGKEYGVLRIEDVKGAFRLRELVDVPGVPR